MFFIVYCVLSLLRGSDFGGLPYDAGMPALAYSVSGRSQFPNFDNPSTLSMVRKDGIGLSFAYSSNGFGDILSYGSKAKLRNLTAVSLFTKGGGFTYRLLGKKRLTGLDFEKEYSIDEFQIVFADLIYYKIYGGIGLKYYYVRYAEASISDGLPHVNLDTGNGFSVNAGAALTFKYFDLGFFLRNIISGIFYHDYPKDVLGLSGGVGVVAAPINSISLSLDCLGERDGKIQYSAGCCFRPIKWALLSAGYSLPDKALSGGVEVNYSTNDFVLSYRKNSVFLTWRLYLK